MIYYNVPVIIQEQSMSCWHAAARMLWGFKYSQSINPLAKIYSKNAGISPPELIDLACELGLESVGDINQTYAWNGINRLLQSNGPLWAAGNWYGAPHVIVITGITPDGTLYVNDPASGKRVHDIDWFNQRVYTSFSHPILFLPDSMANSGGMKDICRRLGK